MTYVSRLLGFFHVLRAENKGNKVRTGDTVVVKYSAKTERARKHGLDGGPAPRPGWLSGLLATAGRYGHWVSFRNADYAAKRGRIVNTAALSRIYPLVGVISHLLGHSIANSRSDVAADGICNRDSHLVAISTNSTRRFFARPSSVLLVATGA